MKSKEWLERGLNHEDPMDCLSNCWIAFNSLYSAYHSSSEIESVKQFINENVEPVTAQKLIDNHQLEIIYFMSQPIVDMRGNGRNSQRDIESYNSSNCPVNKLKSILICIYQVRCNLMHGQKSPSRDRDVILCRHSWPLVAELVDKYA